jgi:hypothetical protein
MLTNTSQLTYQIFIFCVRYFQYNVKVKHLLASWHIKRKFFVYSERKFMFQKIRSWLDCAQEFSSCK